MSDVIKSVFVNYIVCAVAGGFLEYFAPAKSRKTLRVIIIGVILATSIAPVLKMELSIPDFSEYEQISENNSYDALMHTASLTEKKVYNRVRDILINYGIGEYEIYVTTSVDETENIVWLEGVVIEIPAQYGDKAKDIINAVPEEYRSVTRVGEK